MPVTTRRAVVISKGISVGSSIAPARRAGFAENVFCLRQLVGSARQSWAAFSQPEVALRGVWLDINQERVSDNIVRACQHGLRQRIKVVVPAHVRISVVRGHSSAGAGNHHIIQDIHILAVVGKDLFVVDDLPIPVSGVVHNINVAGAERVDARTAVKCADVVRDEGSPLPFGTLGFFGLRRQRGRCSRVCRVAGRVVRTLFFVVCDIQNDAVSVAQFVDAAPGN